MRFETKQLHAGYDPSKDQYGSMTTPLYQTTAYDFESVDYAADLFALKQSGNIYSRISNPTQDMLEQRVSALEGGVGALATSSGHAAVVLTIFTLMQAGDNIISASTVYGGLINMFSKTLPKMGVTTRFGDPDDIASWESLIDDHTKMIFVETLGNPNANPIDLKAAADLAHKHGIVLVADNTFTSPYLCNPIEWDADLVIHSATKYLGGHGTSMGGIVVDSGNFDYTRGRYPGFTDPDPSYHGVCYAKDMGKMAFIAKARVQMLRDLGVCLSPFNCFMLMQGIETLSLRMERICENTLYLAQKLKDHPAITFINHCGLTTDPRHHLAQKYYAKGQGGVFTFGLKGGRESGKKFLDSIKLFANVANLGDAKSLASHPASTTHSQLNEDDLRAGGISGDTIRLCVGIEHKNDLWEDLAQAIEASQK